MGLPWELTIPVSGPWQERQSSAAKRRPDEDLKPIIRAKSIVVTMAIRLYLIEGIKLRKCCTLMRVVTVGLFAESDWGKMRMIQTGEAYFMTPRQFLEPPLIPLQFECRKFQHLMGICLTCGPFLSGSRHLV